MLIDYTYMYTYTFRLELLLTDYSTNKGKLAQYDQLFMEQEEKLNNSIIQSYLACIFINYMQNHL